ncbi:hypothetical protein VZT92_000202 [Zoarces viviparus]|uniref:Uncharacterized protein n=1 Tax=Zoarces viviparus TaxID=48416 RepID=A0AAW1G675_ZOAVI
MGTYGSSKAAATQSLNSQRDFGFRDCQTARPPCPAPPLSGGSFPPTNLPTVGQAALMRRAGDHGSTC